MAYALLGDLELLFLDEPTNGMDPAGMARGAGYDPRPRYRWTHGAAIIGFPDRHSDLKLGLVLVTAAALLKLVDTGNLVAFAAAARLALSAGPFGWLVTALGIGGLAVVAAAIWVDRQPPHTMMAAGAVVVALGLTIVGFSNSFATSALGMFVAGIGGSAVGSLVFYAIAVKGATRYRGTLIGALSMVFTMRLGTRNVDDWPFDALMVVLAISVALTLAGAAVLFRLLPRVFAGSYEPGQTLWEMLAVPSIRRAAVWAAAAFFVASMVTTATDVHLLALMFRSTSGVDDVALQLQTMHIFSGIGVLLWGIAADFYPGRRLFLLAAILLLPAAGALWALDGLPASAVGVVVFGLVRGGLVCLPWVLMAELLPTQHFEIGWEKRTPKSDKIERRRCQYERCPSRKIHEGIPPGSSEAGNVREAIIAGGSPPVVPGAIDVRVLGEGTKGRQTGRCRQDVQALD